MNADHATEPNPEAAISVRGLTKRFGSFTAVDGVDFDVARGTIFGFLGPNGSGKTTTLRMLCGLLTPDSGEGTALGLDIISQANLIKRRAGYMTQKFSLYEDLTIEENLQFSARIHSLDRRKQRVDQALERLGLIERRGQLAGSLSGGWKQRLALATATLHEPKLLLLDEPTAGMGVDDIPLMTSLIADLGKDYGVMLIEHNMNIVMSISDVVTVMSRGSVLVEGKPELVRADKRVREAYLGEAA